MRFPFRGRGPVALAPDTDPVPVVLRKKGRIRGFFRRRFSNAIPVEGQGDGEGPEHGARSPHRWENAQDAVPTLRLPMEAMTSA